MNFKELYFIEDAREDEKKRIFLEKFKETYLPESTLEFSSDMNLPSDAEYSDLSIEIFDADTKIEWKNPDYQFSIEALKKISTGGFSDIIRFGIRKLFANPDERYTPEDFFARDFLMDMEADVLKMIRSYTKIQLTEDILPPAETDSGDWSSKMAESGLYSPVFESFYDVQEKRYSAKKRLLEYDNDVFIIVRGKARK